MTWTTAVVGLGLLLGATWEHRPGRAGATRERRPGGEEQRRHGAGSG